LGDSSERGIGLRETGDAVSAERRTREVGRKLLRCSAEVATIHRFERPIQLDPKQALGNADGRELRRGCSGQPHGTREQGAPSVPHSGPNGTEAVEAVGQRVLSLTSITPFEKRGPYLVSASLPVR